LDPNDINSEINKKMEKSEEEEYSKLDLTNLFSFDV